MKLAPEPAEDDEPVLAFDPSATPGTTEAKPRDGSVPSSSPAVGLLELSNVSGARSASAVLPASTAVANHATAPTSTTASTAKPPPPNGNRRTAPSPRPLGPATPPPRLR